MPDRVEQFVVLVGRAVPDNESLNGVGHILTAALHSDFFHLPDNESLSAVGYSPTYEKRQAIRSW